MFVVLVNCPDSQTAELIAESLIESSIAACVNILPEVKSVYRWQGELVKETEVTMLIKCAASNMTELSSRVRTLHPYDTVEVLALPVDIENSDPDYVNWVRTITPKG